MTNRECMESLDDESFAKALKLFAFCQSKGCPAKCNHWSNRNNVACKNNIVKWLKTETY